MNRDLNHSSRSPGGGNRRNNSSREGGEGGGNHSDNSSSREGGGEGGGGGGGPAGEGAGNERDQKIARGTFSVDDDEEANLAVQEEELAELLATGWKPLRPS